MHPYWDLIEKPNYGLDLILGELRAMASPNLQELKLGREIQGLFAEVPIPSPHEHLLSPQIPFFLPQILRPIFVGMGARMLAEFIGADWLIAVVAHAV
jgi:hypothetical protein